MRLVIPIAYAAKPRETYLVDRIDEREHGPGVPVHYERTIELVRPKCGLRHSHGRVWLAEDGRCVQVAQIFSLVEAFVVARRSSKASDRH